MWSSRHFLIIPFNAIFQKVWQLHRWCRKREPWVTFWPCWRSVTSQKKKTMVSLQILGSLRNLKCMSVFWKLHCTLFFFQLKCTTKVNYKVEEVFLSINCRRNTLVHTSNWFCIHVCTLVTEHAKWSTWKLNRKQSSNTSHEIPAFRKRHKLTCTRVGMKSPANASPDPSVVDFCVHTYRT